MDEDVESFLSTRQPTIAGLARRLCETILAMMPDATISIDAENIGFGFGTGYKGLVFTVAPHTAHVTLGVAGGASLPDPDGLLEGSGKVHRHVKLRGVTEVDRPELRALMESAVAAKS
jgi:hypothetical protein